MGLALVTVATMFYGVARAVGLADPRRRMDLVERSVRHGEGDSEFANALQRGAEGEWD